MASRLTNSTSYRSISLILKFWRRVVHQAYNVVFRTLRGISEGCIIWRSYESPENFNKCYDEEMRARYEIVARGITQEQAIELCSTAEADLAVEIYFFRKSVQRLEQLIGQI